MTPQYPIQNTTVHHHLLGLKIKRISAARIICPTSPNITPMKKPNVVIYRGAGLNYWYAGTP